MLSSEEINLLKNQNEGYRKQNNALQSAFIKILSICNEPADSVAVLEFQKRIKKVLDE